MCIILVDCDAHGSNEGEGEEGVFVCGELVRGTVGERCVLGVGGEGDEGGCEQNIETACLMQMRAIYSTCYVLDTDAQYFKDYVLRGGLEKTCFYVVLVSRC